MSPQKKSSAGLMIFLTLVLSAAIGVVVAGLIWALTLDIPDFTSFETRKIIQSTKIYDRSGEILLYDVHGNIKRTVISFEEIPRQVKNAAVAIEDSNFYQHKGISFTSIIRALLTNLKSGEIRQGGSTITQQLVKNTFLGPEQTLTRKLKEMILAFKVERAYSKEEILGLYLNEIPYGSSNYGIEAASRSFFGKKAEELTLAETAYLAALPKAPTYYSPYGAHREELEQRKNLVLKRMLNLGFVSQEDHQKALEENVSFVNKGDETIKAPHFVLFIKNQLVEKYGEEAVEQGGLYVTTTLDWPLQAKAEDLVKKYAEENEEKFNAFNAGLTAVDPKTGEILVMVGSRDWHGEPRPENCQPGLDCKFEPKPNVAVYGKGRQPGSAFKPFVYATAFEKGYTPETVVFDLKTEFNASCNPDGTPQPGTSPEECYQPQNYDNIFRGPVTFREALAQSINVPSVKVLYLAGIKESIKTAEKLGISTLKGADRYGLTLVLGGGEVHLLEMVGAYSVFANDGVKNFLNGILKIEDSRGQILEQFSPKPERVLEQNIARIINNILSDNSARTPAFGERSWLYFEDREVAAKTGTTNDYRDAWVIGYTPSFALGVWVGNNDNASMEKRVAGFIAAPLWNAFFKEAFSQREKATLGDKPTKEEFEKPEKQPAPKPFLRGEWRGGQAYLVEKSSGKLATEFTPKESLEEKVLIQIHSILYWLNKNDPAGPTPANHQDPQFRLWEEPVRTWAENQNIKEQSDQDRPKETDDLHKPEYQPSVSIISPVENATINPEEPVPVEIKYQSHFPLKQVDFFLDNVYLGSANKEPFDFVFSLSGDLALKEEGILKLVVYDEVKNSSIITRLVRFGYLSY